MTNSKFEIVPVEAGTFLRMDPRKHPEGKFVLRTTIFGREICEEGLPIFEVKSYVLDREGGHVTFEREGGTFYVLGGGTFVDIKFPYPHPMFQVVGDAEAQQVRLLWRATTIAKYERRRLKWPSWRRSGLAKCARA